MALITIKLNHFCKTTILICRVIVSFDSCLLSKLTTQVENRGLTHVYCSQLIQGANRKRDTWRNRLFPRLAALRNSIINQKNKTASRNSILIFEIFSSFFFQLDDVTQFDKCFSFVKISEVSIDY